jgi:hypothetical protein
MVGDDPNVILRGSIWYRNSSLCGWSADQMDLLEYGVDPCREAWRSVADVLGMRCGPQRGVSIMMGPQSRRGSYVVMWPRM